MSLGGSGKLSPGLLTDTTRVGLQSAWSERIEEAELLLKAGLWSMGVCLKVYALEVRMKARICEHLNLDLLPRACKTHDLTELVIYSGLHVELEEPANSLVKRYWDRIANFSRLELNNLRYQARVQLPTSLVEQLIEALDDPNDGAFAWLSRPR